MKPSDVPFQEAEIRIVYGIDESGEQIVATTYTAKGVDDSVPDFFAGTRCWRSRSWTSCIGTGSWT